MAKNNKGIDDHHSDERIVLEATRLSKEFSPKKQPVVHALREISLQVQAGRITGLVGPDGAGKTTLLRIAAGLLKPTAGRVTVLGLDSTEQFLQIQSRVGYMPQQFGLYQDLTVQENLDLFSDLQGVPGRIRHERHARLLEMTDLASFTERRAGKLSGGMKQKLGLACSLIKSPQMLLLDEPTVGVDPVSRRDLWQIITQLVTEEGIGVLVATSYLDEAEQCQQVVVLQNGTIVAQDKPEQFRAKMSGRVYRFAPNKVTETRALQTALAGTTGVIDATIRSGRVRCVIDAELTRPVAELIPPSSYQEVSASEPSFEDAFMALAQRPEVRFLPEQPAVAQTRADEVVVQVHNLKKTFGSFTAVQGISFEVQRGQIFGLLGPNGAGKTTTFRMLCGLTSISDGEISVAGHNLRKSRARARANLGYMAQAFSLYRQLSVTDNLKFYGKAYGLYGKRLQERMAWALEEFELQERSDMPAGDLPGGFKQRLAMATAMLHEPALLFLDEPTSGADPLARREFWLRINGFAQQGVTVIVTTHFMEEAEYCDHMLIMSRGTELAQGTPADIRSLARSQDNPDPTIEDAFIALAEGTASPAGLSGGRHE